MWGLCHVFENTLYLTLDLMKHSAVPSNLSVPCLSQIGLPLLPVPRRAPSPGSMFHFSTRSRTATRTCTQKSANGRPPLHCALNGRGILCLGVCYRRFTILSRAPYGVSNEHSCLDRIF